MPFEALYELRNRIWRKYKWWIVGAAVVIVLISALMIMVAKPPGGEGEKFF